jgi:hypothetical protein
VSAPEARAEGEGGALVAVPPPGDAAPAAARLGVILLVHTAFDRAEQLVRHWAGAGCAVVVHVDSAVPARLHDPFRARLADLPRVAFSPRHRCEWGTWGLVAATLDAARLLLDRAPEAAHVFLASGACLPLRPVEALAAYLAERPRTDFIESATTRDVPWTVGGLSDERFTLRFPFSWRSQRRLFDRWVEIQRRLRLRRRVPPDLVPHMGSQWWCLTRATLRAILDDPERPRLDAYFRHVWIPDESYFQTLARRHEAFPGERIESRSLTLSKFDLRGRPHVFYDDHLELLRRSDCFVARKIWPRAGRLYEAFLAAGSPPTMAEPAPQKIDRVFARAAERRTQGRAGLYMQSRLPREGRENGVTAGPYSVFEGFAEIFEGWEEWLARATGARVHGHLFAPGGAEFSGRAPVFAGGLSAAGPLRDYDPRQFLASLVWATRGERQAFQFGPRDHQGAAWDIVKDPNARVAVISGAWAVPLFRAHAAAEAREARPDDGGGPREEIGPDLLGGPAGEPVRRAAAARAEAARLQRIEEAHLSALRSPWARARVSIWTLAEFLEAPAETLGPLVDEIAARPPAAAGPAGLLTGPAPGAEPAPSRRGAAAEPAPRADPPALPPLVDLRGFGAFLQALRNQGMHPHLMGHFPAELPEPPGGLAEAGPASGREAPPRPPRRRRAYLAR